MKKSKFSALALLLALICLFGSVNVWASENYVYEEDIRSVFENDGYDTTLTYFTYTYPDFGLQNERYIPLVFAIETTAPVNSKAAVKGEPNNYVTIEQVDRYTGSNVYYSVWNSSTKLRIMGHDVQLSHPAFVMSNYDGLEGTAAGYNGTPIALISVDDFNRIYGYDMNYWAEKNTLYFKRNGNGLLQQYKNYNPSTAAQQSSSSSGSSGASGSSSSSESLFTDITGIRPSGTTMYGTEYRNVSVDQLNTYIAVLGSLGYRYTGTIPVRNDVIYHYTGIATYMYQSGNSVGMVTIALSDPVNSRYNVSIDEG